MDGVSACSNVVRFTLPTPLRPVRLGPVRRWASTTLGLDPFDFGPVQISNLPFAVVLWPVRLWSVCVWVLGVPLGWVCCLVGGCVCLDFTKHLLELNPFLHFHVHVAMQLRDPTKGHLTCA